MPKPSKNQVIVFLRNMTKWIGSVYLGSILLLCAQNDEKLGRRACLGVKNIGKPCAGKPHARFDEGGKAKACPLLE